MADLLLHPLTARQVEVFTDSPSHALILAGPLGSGKASLARQIATAVLKLDQAFNAYPYQTVIASTDGKAVGIEAIRQLDHFLSLKAPRSQTYNQVVIVEDADLLTLEAQNALLKTLEEPPAGSLIILNTSHEQALLPTIRSRSQLISVNNPAEAGLMTFFEGQGHEPRQIKQAYAISGGLPGLMQALLSDADHPLLLATEQARAFLGGTAYDRLLVVDTLSKQRGLAADTVFILQQMAHVSLQKASGTAAKRWQAVLAASLKAAEDLQNNAQAKLVLDQLALSF